MTGILQTEVWPGMLRLEPGTLLGGIYANKRGYHNRRDQLPMPGRTGDYSVNEYAIDRQGEPDEPCAIDWTFPEAQSGDYRRISKYSARLLAAGRAGRVADPRTVYIREFFGQTDSDAEVEGWDYAKGEPSSSDSSHLWHIHISLHRAYSQDPKAASAILSILAGQSVRDWVNSYARKVTMVRIEGDLPVLSQGDSDPLPNTSGTYWVTRAQRQLEVVADGDYGPATATAVKAMMADDGDRSTTNGSKIGLPEWRRLFGIW